MSTAKLYQTRSAKSDMDIESMNGSVQNEGSFEKELSKDDPAKSLDPGTEEGSSGLGKKGLTAEGLGESKDVKKGHDVQVSISSPGKSTNGRAVSQKSRTAKQGIGAKLSIDTDKLVLSKTDIGGSSSSKCDFPPCDDWLVGDVVWARMGKHPYWPCIVCPDPETSLSRRMKIVGPKMENQVSFHVRFFGDRGQRSWVTLRNCLPFAGAMSQTADKSGPFNVKSHVKPKWNSAVTEAENIISKPREERLAVFEKMLTAMECGTSSQTNKKRKLVTVTNAAEEETSGAPKKKAKPSAREGTSFVKSTRLSSRQASKAEQATRESETHIQVDTKQAHVKPMPVTLPAKVMKPGQQTSRQKTLLKSNSMAYKQGDMLWVRMGCYPYWPSLINNDPNSGTFIKTDGRHTPVKMIHVQFYGDKGRRSWIPASHVKEYHGADALLAEGKTLPPKNKKDKGPYSVKPSMKKAWDHAVTEADSFLPKSREERIGYFKKHFPTQKIVKKGQPNVPENKKKDEIEKRAKKNDLTGNEKKDENVRSRPLKDSKISASNGETSSATINPNSGAQKPRRKRYFKPKKLKKAELEECFQAFKFTSYPIAKEKYPTYNEEEIEKLLQQMWDHKSEQDKAKFLPIIR